ncbi:MAG: DUF302 domain-containing protein [Bacteroidetes bacterium]|nr:DUF302 domain-containing protein [Bacteroidota bacterium]
MKYYIEKTAKYSFDQAIEKITEALKKEGFGVLSEIDMHDKLKEKLDVNFRKYKILGACNPPSAYKALQLENKIGILLPCNVIVQELGPNNVEVAVVNPVVSMQVVENEELEDLAVEIKNKLEMALEYF